MSKTPEILISALRQYQHNDCSGFVTGFDYDEVVRIVERVMNDNKCTWTMDDPDFNRWYAECGFDFRFEDGSPTENGMKFCMNCGKSLVEKKNPDIDYENMEWKGKSDDQ